jgi:hypothetical protein
MTTDSEYFAIDAFSQSVANKLLNDSPRHAVMYKRAMMQRAGQPDPDHDRNREIGTIVHKLLLGSTTSYREIPHDNYRTKAAQELRSLCEAEGVTPILSPDLERCRKSASALTEQLREEFGIDLDGESERVMQWTENVRGAALPCKAKLDHVRADGLTILDIKSGDANPRQLVRRILDQGYHVQAAAYSRALGAATGKHGLVRFLDIFIETKGLTLCTPVAIEGSLYELGERAWLRACSKWVECESAGFWPGYVTEVIAPEAPDWALKAEMG